MLLDILKSLGQLTKHILFGNQPDVVLYYPQHFNRSKKGTNPYFEPIVEVSKENGVKYLLLEEPDSSTPSPRDPQCMKADAIFWTAIVLRKIFRRLCKGTSFYKIDYKIGRILAYLTFNKFKAKTYITISNSMHEVLAGLNPKGMAYDYQHGIIQNGHEGYFDHKDKLNEMFEFPNVGILLWGPLYKRSFKSALSQERLESIIKVVGYPIPSATINTINKERKYILISLQMTDSGSKEWLKGSMDMLEEALVELQDCGKLVLLKHHPRYNNCIDLSEVLERYPFVEVTHESLQELVPKTLLHITYFSTTCFEYANFGIPTYYLYNDKLPLGKIIFYDQYYYPLYAGTSLTDVLKRISKISVYTEDCKTVKEWHEGAYAPFDKQQMLKILTGNEY